MIQDVLQGDKAGYLHLARGRVHGQERRIFAGGDRAGGFGRSAILARTASFSENLSRRGVPCQTPSPCGEQNCELDLFAEIIGVSERPC